LCALPQVQPSSDEGDEEESLKEDEVTADEGSHPNAGTRNKKRVKQNATESDFTLDQIAAIIGIVK
jgi:hypothetical protein